MNELTYTKQGDFLIPDLALGEEPSRPLGKYGMMRRDYLEQNRPTLFQVMILEGTLYKHLLEIEDTAQTRIEQMMPLLAKEAGATEALKASNQLKWVGLMNNCKAQAEEIIQAELIFS